MQSFFCTHFALWILNYEISGIIENCYFSERIIFTGGKTQWYCDKNVIMLLIWSVWRRNEIWDIWIKGRTDVSSSIGKTNNGTTLQIGQQSRFVSNYMVTWKKCEGFHKLWLFLLQSMNTTLGIISPLASIRIKSSQKMLLLVSNNL